MIFTVCAHVVPTSKEDGLSSLYFVHLHPIATSTSQWNMVSDTAIFIIKRNI